MQLRVPPQPLTRHTDAASIVTIACPNSRSDSALAVCSLMGISFRPAEEYAMAHARRLRLAAGCGWHTMRMMEFRVLGPLVVLSGGRELALASLHQRRLHALFRQTGSPTIAAWAEYVTGEALAAADPLIALRHLDTAAATARQAGNRLIEGVALVAATACRARHGEPTAALPAVAAAISHWRRHGDWTHQWPTLRTAAILLSRTGDHQSAVTIAAAVAAAGPPAYGREADDLATVRAAARSALGPSAAEAANRAGAALEPSRAVPYAMAAVARSERGSARRAPARVQ